MSGEVERVGGLDITSSLSRPGGAVPQSAPPVRQAQPTPQHLVAPSVLSPTETPLTAGLLFVIVIPLLGRGGPAPGRA